MSHGSCGLLGTTKGTDHNLFRSKDLPKFQFFLPAALDGFLDIGTNNQCALLGNNTTHTNHLATAFFVTGILWFLLKRITPEHTFIVRVLC